MPTIKLPLVLYYLAVMLLMLASMQLASAANQVPEQEKAPDLTDLSMEALLKLDVTSITKKSTELKDVPAAISVLTAEDIRRSGATSIPEALRMVPGLHVARIDGNKWAISARGFNSQFGTKLLVLMDGRTLYTPMFSVVWWDQEDVMMEDIERIEVIRGPGGSLWGANAVNGVINIVTKKAKDSQGGLVSGQGGSMREGGSLRYGVDLGKQAYLKVYGRYSEYDQSKIPFTPQTAGDESSTQRLGFRFDKEAGDTDKLTLQGDLFSGFSGGAEQNQANVSGLHKPVVSPPYERAIATDTQYDGHYLLGRWEHRLDNASSTVLRSFWNHNQRESNIIQSAYHVDTFDLDFQHNLQLAERHGLIWGVGFRFNQNQTTNSVDLGWQPTHRHDEIYSLFVQDDINLIPERWKLTLGTKLEHNPVTDFEWQPNARLMWTPVKQQAFWASVSRSVRTPSWVEQDLQYNTDIIPPVGGGNASPYNPVTLVPLMGNKNMRAETMLAYEVGWRAELTPQFTADTSLYFYEYEDLCSFIPTYLDLSHLLSGYVVQFASFANAGSATVRGSESSLDWRVNDSWKLRASYSYADQHFQLSDQLTNGAFIFFQDSFPKNQAMLWSMHKLTSRLNFDVNWRFVDSVKVEQAMISAYHEMDARLAWDIGHGVELAVVGRNLLNNRHVEFGSFLYSIPTAVQREVYATVRWSF